jgi:hypothetical protein
MMKELVIHGWNVGLDKISLTKTMRAEFGYSLSQGKSVTDRVLSNEEVRIPLEDYSVEESRDVCKRFQELGINVSIENAP